jgi:hypothetical protein
MRDSLINEVASMLKERHQKHNELIRKAIKRHFRDHINHKWVEEDPDMHSGLLVAVNLKCSCGTKISIGRLTLEG